MTGHLGLYLEMRWADLPDVVMTIIAAARLFADASTAEMATVLATSSGGFSYKYKLMRLNEDLKLHIKYCL